jgi:hypothetical protein
MQFCRLGCHKKIRGELEREACGSVIGIHSLRRFVDAQAVMFD